MDRRGSASRCRDSGAALWPAAHEIFWLSEWLGLTTLSEKQISEVQGMLEQIQSLPLGLILVTLAIVPAIFEELCFRGFIFGALQTRLTAVWTIVASALLFGVFHEILSPGRLLPSTFLGLALDGSAGAPEASGPACCCTS